MGRLPFRLPEWSPRTSWVSEEARSVWEPRLQRISNAWIETERDLVADGFRPSALQNVSPTELPELMKQEALRGLTVLPLAQVARVQGYQSASTQLEDGAAFDYRCAITTASNAAAWAAAWSKSNDEEIGKLLGYPECCREFFAQFWLAERWFDTTWPMAQSSDTVVEVPPGVGILWRWHGVRTISHLPCSFHCAESKALGESAIRVMAQRFPEEAQWLAEIYSWPVEWSALHGIAEIRTPITRVAVATDATAEKLVVRYMGTGYPLEGASGTGFPHRTVIKPVMLMSNSKDNGFSSHQAMTEAHDTLLKLVNGSYGTVLDLGCGDGLLLSKIKANRRVGVEQNERIAKLAEKRADRVVVGDCTSKLLVERLLFEENPDLVIAQCDRNPVEMFDSYNLPNLLSYTYEGGAYATLAQKA